MSPRYLIAVSFCARLMYGLAVVNVRFAVTLFAVVRASFLTRICMRYWFGPVFTSLRSSPTMSHEPFVRLSVPSLKSAVALPESSSVTVLEGITWPGATAETINVLSGELKDTL